MNIQIIIPVKKYTLTKSTSKWFHPNNQCVLNILFCDCQISIPKKIIGNTYTILKIIFISINLHTRLFYLREIILKFIIRFICSKIPNQIIITK